MKLTPIQKLVIGWMLKGEGLAAIVTGYRNTAIAGCLKKGHPYAGIPVIFTSVPVLFGLKRNGLIELSRESFICQLTPKGFRALVKKDLKK